MVEQRRWSQRLMLSTIYVSGRVLYPSAVCQPHVTKWSPAGPQPTDHSVLVPWMFGTLVQQALVPSETHASFAWTFHGL